MLGKKLIVGLSGASCGGKTTVSKLLQASFPWTTVVHQDAYFHPNEAKYHVFIPEINHFNWELKSALDLKKMERDLTSLISAKEELPFSEKARFFPNDNFVKKNRPDESTVNYLSSRYASIPLIIIEGHILFNHKPFYDLCDLRFFFHLEREECRQRREERVYDPPNPKGFFEKCVWPDYAQRLEEVRKLPGIEYFDAKTIPLLDIYKQILKRMTNTMDTVNAVSVVALDDNMKTDDASSVANPTGQRSLSEATGFPVQGQRGVS